MYLRVKGEGKEGKRGGNKWEKGEKRGMKRGRGGIKESERREIKGRVKGGRRDVPPASAPLRSTIFHAQTYFSRRYTHTHTHIYTDCRHCMTYSPVGLNNINFYQLVT